MVDNNRASIKRDEKKEMRTKETSQMISEGGLVAEKYDEMEKVEK